MSHEDRRKLIEAPITVVRHGNTRAHASLRVVDANHTHAVAGGFKRYDPTEGE
jgi:hypothetical protein